MLSSLKPRCCSLLESAVPRPFALCSAGLQTAGAQPVQVAVQSPDTATVRLHISKMTWRELSHHRAARFEATEGRIQRPRDVGRQSRRRALRPAATQFPRRSPRT